MATRKKSPTNELAEWFVSKILGVEFNYVFHRAHLAAAKQLINPKEGTGLDIEIVKMCLEDLRDGKYSDWKDRPVTSLWAVTWGTPPYYERTLLRLREVPPVYQVRAYDDWVARCGRMARDLGYWDGVYLGWENPIEAPFRPSREEIASVLAS